MASVFEGIRTRTKLFRIKQAPSQVPLSFFCIKILGKGLTDVFRRCKPSSKVRRKYLVMKKLKNQEPKQSRYSPLSKVRFMF